jgi:hypothetical protein
MRGSEICLSKIVQNGLVSIGTGLIRRARRVLVLADVVQRGDMPGRNNHKSHGHSRKMEKKKKERVGGL